MPGTARQAPIEVTVETRGQEIVAGTLWVHERGGQSATFRYTDEYLISTDSYDLDPALPKSSGVFQTAEERAVEYSAEARG
jgi:serine/threonine-protein kinase HipA